MSASADATFPWLKHWLYDWGGANVDLFLAVQRGMPDDWIWLADVLSAVGSNWGAPFVVITLLVWRRMLIGNATLAPDVALCRLLLGLPLAVATAALAKESFALPRPFVLLGEAVYRSSFAPDSHYTMPSGHAVYVAVLAMVVWPLLDRSGRIGVLLFAAAVGWSRIVLGAHFPIDVITGYALGAAIVVAVGPLARRIALRLRIARANP